MKKRFNEAVRLYNLKRYEMALNELLTLYDEVPDESEDKAEIAYYLGLSLTQLERYDEALLYLEQVITLHTNLLYIYQSRMILGYIYAVTKRYKLSEYEFNKLLSEGAESQQIYAALGYIFYEQNQIDESITNLKMALELDGNYTNALNSLGYIYAENDINIPEAIKLCKSAVRLKPKNAAYLDSLGWAYFKNGQLEEAKKYIRKALDISPGNKEIIDHMKKVLS
jgi:tetratricopeptide (TPR) repeat protein